MTRRCRRCIALVAGLSLVVIISPARAEQCPAQAPANPWAHLIDSRGEGYVPMRYRVDEQGGLRVLVAEGVIGLQEQERLAAALRQAGRISEVVFDSPGGNSYAGMEMGRLIRKLGLATRVAATGTCFSACSMAFLGGVFRRVDPSGAYGVHMASSYGQVEDSLDFAEELAQMLFAVIDEKANAQNQYKLALKIQDKLQEMEQQNARWARERANFLIEMSVSLRLMIPNIDTPAYGEHYLCRRDLRAYNVVNVE
jgi:hypothetical protein